jgi:hypothetical protein
MLANSTPAAKVAETLEGIGLLPVLPREAEDILAISSRERRKWLKEGRLTSIGTRSVKLRGRAKAVTFHIFDPLQIEDALDRDLPAIWRDEDAQSLFRHRRRPAETAALTRTGKALGTGEGARRAREKHAARPKLDGWEAFEAEGLLR